MSRLIVPNAVAAVVAPRSAAAAPPVVFEASARTGAPASASVCTRRAARRVIYRPGFDGRVRRRLHRCGVVITRVVLRLLSVKRRVGRELTGCGGPPPTPPDGTRRWRGWRTAALLCAALLIAPVGGAESESQPRRGCQLRPVERASLPSWLLPRRATVLVDSVLLGGVSALRARRPCWRARVYGRPALMIRFAADELRERANPVARLAVVGLGYNSLWERGRRRYRVWARRFDREARELIRALRRRGARQVVWVTLREPTRRTVPPQSRDELGQYSWYFPYVNERLRRLDRRRDDLVLADWAKASDRPGLTYDSIHLNTKGAALMARTIWGTVSREARRQAKSNAKAVMTPPGGALAPPKFARGPADPMSESRPV